MAALVVGIATSNSFMLPTHQVNALYMGPGRYRSVDFMKAGGIMSILFIGVLIGMLYLFYGI
jgi:di/tricarboxylate transporter